MATSDKPVVFTMCISQYAFIWYSTNKQARDITQ